MGWHLTIFNDTYYQRDKNGSKKINNYNLYGHIPVNVISNMAERYALY